MKNKQLVEMSLRETQMASLDLLKKIDEICKSNNIKYFLIYGSLLGAIRHKGFIPWDDDLDIGMLREDYNKFCNYCIEHRVSLGKFQLDNNDTRKGVPFALSRFCNTEYILKFNQYSTYKSSGIFVDIYPFDGAGNDRDIEYWKKVAFKRFTIRQCVFFACSKDYFIGDNFLRRVEKLPFILYAKLRTSDYFINKLKKYACHFDMNQSDYVSCIMWTSLKIIPRYKKEWFEDLIYTDFEDMKVPIPKEYNDFLTSEYGDYMKFPPEKDRHPYHGYIPYRINKDKNDY